MTVEKGTEPKEVIKDLGWGRLVFGQTFDDPGEAGHRAAREASGRRDIGMYLEAPTSSSRSTRRTSSSIRVSPTGGTSRTAGLHCHRSCPG